jgi:8-oxo-dGTP pyrophosphatase MutT (NUDIX family)
MPDPDIRAAGGVVIHDGQVVLVHRPHHDDWSLPKGKLEAGETWLEAAVREVEEECGLRCRLGGELPATEYSVADRSKRVRWWLIRVESDLGFAPSDEVDELRWVAFDEAVTLLTYDSDRDVLRAAVSAI